MPNAKGRQCCLLFPERAEVKARCALLGFSDKAKLDEGPMWPTAYTLKELAAAKRLSCCASEENGKLKVPVAILPSGRARNGRSA